jgi:molybdopterin molybdotransferase
LSFQSARSVVLRQLRDVPRTPTERTPLEEADGRVLAEDVRADRDFPPATRSLRDGFAVRSADLPGELRVVGEVRAGAVSESALRTGEAIEIMTGAPVPAGADAVVMLEHVTRQGDRIQAAQSVSPGENLNPRGSEARAGSVVLAAGVRLSYSEIAFLAAAGRTEVKVHRRPRVAVLATGDEIVEVAETPLDHQVRNSNVISLAVQVRRCGGDPIILPVARDNEESTRSLIESGLSQDLLLISGGVSAGKYDVVEPALARLGAEFFFTRVLVQPGQPLVFGRARGSFFFGLPGNPASTMVTFEVFARAAVELLSGLREPALPVTFARLTRELRQGIGLTRFLPGRLSADGLEVTPVPWKGSSDVPALARANVYVMTDPDREAWAAGDLIQVLAK